MTNPEQIAAGDQANPKTKFYDGKPGDYLCHCSCGKYFFGAKLDTTCPECVSPTGENVCEQIWCICKERILSFETFKKECSPLIQQAIATATAQRDFEWWQSSIAPTPKAVKGWVIAERELVTSQKDAENEELKGRVALLVKIGHKHGWNGIENSKILANFFDDTITSLQSKLSDLQKLRQEMREDLEFISDQSCTGDVDVSGVVTPCTETDLCITEYCWPCYAKKKLEYYSALCTDAGKDWVKAEPLLGMLREYLSMPSLDGNIKRQELRQQLNKILSTLTPSTIHSKEGE